VGTQMPLGPSGVVGSGPKRPNRGSVAALWGSRSSAWASRERVGGRERAVTEAMRQCAAFPEKPAAPDALCAQAYPLPHPS